MHTIAGARRRLADAGLIAVVAVILLLPALWNGYPFIFFDTGDYLTAALSGERVVYRDPVYSLLLAPLRLHHSLWGVAIGQSLLTAWLLFETSCQILPRDRVRWAFLAIAAVLTVGSSLPWFSGQVMPDILGALAVLLVFLLALGDLSPIRYWGLGGVLALALASHLSFLPLGAGLLILLLPLKRLLARRNVRLRLAAIAVAVALAPGIIVAANVSLGGAARLSETSHAFLLARLVQDGLAKQTLDRLCPDAGLTLCAVKDRLPATANDFLWGDSEAFALVGGWLDSKAEADRIFAASLKLFPFDHLTSAVKLSAQQFISFDTGDGLESQAEPWGVIEAKFPGDLAAYTGALQQTHLLPLRAVNRLHRPLAILAMGLLPLLGAMAWRRGRFRESLGLLLIGAALLGNAVICGVLSNPNDRYESRVVWLAVFALCLAAADWRFRKNP